LTQTKLAYRFNPVETNVPTGSNVLDFFGGRVRALRKSQERSQEAVAARMRALEHDWHQTTVSKVEKGQRTISLREAYDLAQALDRHLRDFLIGETSEHERASLAVQVAFARRDALRLVRDDVAARCNAADDEVERLMASAPKPGLRRKA
jgi:transcriptional regulator with XRE-family HTH domain